MAYELLIRNGTLIDGSGAPAFRGDVAVQDGRIAEIGRIADGADSVIDAADCMVAPGFIDPHTHYDAQICWDNAITPSSWHGVTSAVLGNCGVGIAPCLPQAREIAMRDLVNVEAIAYDVLEEGITWDWESFPEYLDAAARRGPVLNLAFLAPLTPFRHYVMGDESIERAATAAETARIRDVIAEAMMAGAFGFSSTILNQHVGFQGRPLACRNASRDELKAYANVLKQMGKGVIEVALTRQIGVLDDEQCDMLDFLLEESGRPVTFIALFDRDDIPEAVRDTLRRAAPMIAKGARPQTSPLPLTRNINMRNPFTFAAFPSWGQVFEDTSRESQRAIYADPGFRDRFREDLKRPQTVINWDRLVLHEAQASEIRRFEGQSVAEIAQTRGGDEVNAFLDVAVADNLACEYTYASFNTRPERMRELLNDPSVLLGLGDGGAHLDILCDSGYPTYLLGTWVRERQAITSEEAVRRLTSDPADMFGIRDRGRLKPGLAADICVYDPATVGSSNRGERRHDLPGGGKRMVMPSRGICYTVVNGRIVYADGALTGDAGGQVLRS
jgi:N-acyl-D-aspartate/D-glutamate deacylase